nr:endonuclease VII [uncultured phage]CAI9752235.1 endonuclease VII [uncultured phage]
MTKICYYCQQEKDISEFWKNKNKSDGYEIYCKTCANKRKAEQRAKITKQQQMEQQQKLNGKKICTQCNVEQNLSCFNKDKSTKDGLSSRCKNCQKAYDEQRKEQRQMYYKENIETFIKYRQENREKNIIYQREYRKKNKDLLNEKDKQRNKERMLNLNYHLSKMFSNSLCASLKENKAGRHWENLVPYTLQQLKEHLEKQFDKNMSWNNMGEYWEIDHIIPRNLFKYQSEQDEQFQICWSLNNLRPLSMVENRSRPKDGRDLTEEQVNKILGHKFKIGTMGVEDKEEHKDV